MSLGQMAFLATDVPAKNSANNGDFSSGVGSWLNTGGSLTANENTLSYSVVTPHTYARIYQDGLASGGRKYYCRADILPVFSNITRFYVGVEYGEILNVVPNAWNTLSSVVTAVNDGIFGLYHRTNTEYQVGDVIKFRNMMLIDLTTAFGAGNEPTKKQMDMLLSQFPNGWFDGTKNLFNAKHFINSYHKKITELENAITTLGGGS